MWHTLLTHLFAISVDDPNVTYSYHACIINMSSEYHMDDGLAIDNMTEEGNETLYYDDELYEGPEETMWFVSWAEFLWTLLILFTVIANLLVILTIKGTRKLRTVPNMFLTSMAVADLGVAIFVMPYNAYVTFGDHSWSLKISSCKVFLSGDFIFCTSSIWHLCAIAYDRYEAVLEPLKYNGQDRKRKTLIAIASIWTISAVLAAWLLHINPFPSRVCYINPGFFTLTWSIISFYIPLVILTGVYLRIYVIVRKSFNTGLSISSSTRTRELRMTMIMAIIIGVFVVSWLPIKIIDTAYFFCTCHICHFKESLIIIWTVLSYSNSAMNPIIYVAFNKEFREFLWTLLILVTLIGNILIILTIKSTRSLRNATNLYLASMAVADLGVAIFVMPLAAYRTFGDGIWSLKIGACKVFLAGDFLFTTSSIWHLSAIAFDRYEAVSQPLQYNAQDRKKKTALVIAIIWLMSAVFAFWLLVLNHWPSEECYLRAGVFSLTWTILSFYVPLVGLVVFYLRIYSIVHSSFAGGPSIQGSTRSREIRMTMIMALIIGVFVICWLPLKVVDTANFFCPCYNCQYQDSTFIILSVLSYSNSMMNPIIYTAFNREFRGSLKNYILCRSPADLKRRDTKTSLTSKISLREMTSRL
ncbi:Dopamine receptor 1 [Halotydeus destructor]|nr:Dopamine receptor 1 [Halotydeus destructor]